MRRFVSNLIGSTAIHALAAAGLWLSLPVAAAHGQAPVSTRRLTGTVTQAAGQPVPFATVTALGAPTPARVDPAGRFTLTVPAGPATITTRAIGFAPREVRVAATDSVVRIVLDAQAITLGEITIAGTRSDADRLTATTAGAQITAEQVTRAPAQSIEQALQGKILGASINMNTGAPGGGGQIQIRGTSSILGSGEPLIVIDGAISSNDAFSAGASTVTRGGASQDQNVNRLADINPQEIESIEIVKDASATAIYGSRASNGVVVIRTKRGQNGAPRINLSQRVGVAEPLRYLGSRQYTSVAEVKALRFGATTNATSTSYLDARFPSGVIPADANVDLERAFFDNRKPAYETSVSAAGGSGGTRYFTSATQRHEEGIATNNGATLQSLRVNVDQTWSSRLTASVSVNALRNKLARGLANNDNSFTSPVYAFAYTPGVFDLRERDVAGNFVRNPIFGGGVSSSNPFETYAFLEYDQDVARQLGSATLQYAALARAAHRVDLTLLAGFDRYEQSGRLYSPGFLQYEGRNGLFGTAEQATVDGLNHNLQGTAVWTFVPSARITARTTLGGSLERQAVNNYALVGRGLVPGSESAAQGTVSTSQSRLAFHDQAVFVDEQLTALNERLIVNGGARADRSSANGDPAHFYLFPRASAAYRIVAPIAHLDEVKVRAGWGQTGNRPRFGDRDVTLDAGGIVQGQSSTQVSSTVGNPRIKPETLTETSGGVDVHALGDRLGLEATAYRRTITDLLLQPSAAPSTGFSTLLINAGTLRNRGIELALSATPIESHGVTWTSRATYQRRSEVVVSLPASVPPFSAPNSFGASFGRNRITAGRRTSSIWGNVPVDASGKILPVGAYVTTPGLVAARVDTIIGDANPDFQSFFENTITWRRFRLGATLDWRHGGDVANTTTKLYDEGGQSRDFTTPVAAGNAPRGTPSSSIGQIPAAVLGLGDFRFRSWSGGSDARLYLQDGSYVRLRDVALTFEAPVAIARRVRASGLRLGIEARNVALWSDYWGYDPEFNNFGNSNLNRFIDTAPYPGVRSFAFSLALTY